MVRFSSVVVATEIFTLAINHVTVVSEKLSVPVLIVCWRRFLRRLNTDDTHGREGGGGGLIDMDSTLLNRHDGIKTG